MMDIGTYSSDEIAHDNREPYLWMAVMDRAVRDLVALERFKTQQPTILEDPVFRYDYRNLLKWFRSPSMEPGAFNWICSLVNIDPSWALGRLEKEMKVALKPASKTRKKAKTTEDSKAMAA